MQLNTETLFKSLAEISPDELDRKGLEGDTLLIERINYFAGIEELKLQGGWKAFYVGYREDGSTGQIILLPNHEYTTGLWIKGQKQVAVNAGLPEQYIDKWLASRVHHKHRLLPAIVKCLKDDKLKQSYLNFSHEFTREESLKWEARNDIRDGLSHNMRVKLRDLLKEWETPKKKKRNSVKKKTPRPVAALVSDEVVESKEDAELHAVFNERNPDNQELPETDKRA